MVTPPIELGLHLPEQQPQEELNESESEEKGDAVTDPITLDLRIGKRGDYEMQCRPEEINPSTRHDDPSDPYHGCLLGVGWKRSPEDQDFILLYPDRDAKV